MQRVSMMAVTLVLAALLWVSPARGYTPESGVWWNPAEPGYGLQLEIQDNFAAVFLFTYDVAGNAQWYVANGFLTGNALFVGELDAFRSGTCLGCVPSRPAHDPFIHFPGAGGPIRIEFDADDPTRALVTFGGRTVPFERYQFYLQRPEDQQQLPGVANALTKMLGEWQMVLDFTDNPNASFQYFGDIVILDRLDRDNLGDYVDGCRAADSEIGFCRQVDVDDRYAAAQYAPASDEHFIVVENDATTYAAYIVRVGTNDFKGDVSVYPRGTNPTVFYPVNGFRSASRSFVQEGIGPSKQADQRAAPARPLPLSAEPGTARSKQLDAGQLELLRRLEARVQAARAAR